MSPRRFQPALVEVRLVEIDRLLGDLTVLGEVTAEQLRCDRLRRHAVERVLTLLVDLAAGVNAHLAASHLDAPARDYRSPFAGAADTGAISAELAARWPTLPGCATSSPTPTSRWISTSSLRRCR